MVKCGREVVFIVPPISITKETPFQEEKGSLSSGNVEPNQARRLLRTWASALNFSEAALVSAEM